MGKFHFRMLFHFPLLSGRKYQHLSLNSVIFITLIILVSLQDQFI